MFEIYALVVPLLPACKCFAITFSLFSHKPTNSLSMVFGVVADGALLFAQLGDNVTFPCFSDGKYLSWYRQVIGGEPEMISSLYIYSPATKTFHGTYRDNERLSVHSGEHFYHLNISNVQYADSAAYFCAQTSHPAFTEFQDGIVLLVKGRFLSIFYISGLIFSVFQKSNSFTFRVQLVLPLAAQVCLRITGRLCDPQLHRAPRGQCWGPPGVLVQGGSGRFPAGGPVQSHTPRRSVCDGL